MLGSQKWNTYTYIHLLQCGKGVNLISDTPRVLWLLRDNWFGKSLKVLKSTSERVQTFNIRSSQGKVPLDVRIVPLNQSTLEIRTKVDVLWGLSLKVVTLEFIVRVLSKKSTILLSS